jgi:hypothetical protein
MVCDKIYNWSKNHGKSIKLCKQEAIERRANNGPQNTTKN